MPVRSREEAIQVLRTREGVLVDLVHEAVGDFYKNWGSHAFMLEGWTKASIIRDLTKEKLQRFAEIDPGLAVIRRGNATSLRMDDAFTARIKRLDEKKRARLSRTRASRDFNQNRSGQGSLSLEDKPLTASYLGYVPNENDPLRPSIFFVVNDETGRHAWEPIELVSGATIQTSLVPLTETEEPRERSRARVKQNAPGKKSRNG